MDEPEYRIGKYEIGKMGGNCIKYVGKRYNVDVQVAAGLKIEYTSSAPLSWNRYFHVDGVFVWSSGPNEAY